MKKSIFASFLITGIGIFAFITYIKGNTNPINDLLTTNVELLTRGEKDDDKPTQCSNETFIPDQALQSAQCLSGEPIKNAKNMTKFVAIPVRERTVLPLFISHNTQEGPFQMALFFKI